MNTIILINPSQDVIVSLAAIHILSQSGLDGSSLWRMTISVEISHHGFLKNFRIKIRAQASTFFPYKIFLYYINIHMVHEREKCTPLRSYISRAVNLGGVKCLWESEFMRGPLP